MYKLSNVNVEDYLPTEYWVKIQRSIPTPIINSPILLAVLKTTPPFYFNVFNSRNFMINI
ncbi:hypothetical protein [Alkaliphilus hydrothermalis]|uniref:hypothetical protein n=1 Tax=Alkaliphilus hydrothermalis TaxID=1482730 RepID=UPI00195E153B|nr:hypothetical protein [Alkaliphilus hydrothermalis]